MLHDIEELKAACLQYTRKSRSRSIATIIAITLYYSALYPFRTQLLGFYRDHFGDRGAEVLYGLTLSLLPGFVVFYIVYWVSHRSLKANAVFQCTHCRKSIFYGRRGVVATGNCYHCARRIFDVATQHMEQSYYGLCSFVLFSIASLMLIALEITEVLPFAILLNVLGITFGWLGIKKPTENPLSRTGVVLNVIALCYLACLHIDSITSWFVKY